MTGRASTNNPTERTAWRYQLVLWVVALPIAGLTLWQAVRHRQWRYLWQRLGFSQPSIAPAPLWIHAASVGEVLTAVPLIIALLSDNEDAEGNKPRPLLITTVTATGAQMVLQRFSKHLESGQVIHAYLPIDWQSSVHRFLNLTRPSCALMMETELWPNLYAACAQRNIPLLIINARLSKKTLQAPAWIRTLYRRGLQQVRAILARSPQDAEHYQQLGATADQVKIIGNLKFSAASQLKSSVPITLPRSFVLAASTHDDEEYQLARQWLSLNLDEQLLVIAPRHPQRCASILKQLQQLTPNIAVRSHNDTITQDTRIYLADTLGELTGFMASAEAIIMGGSFVPVGGHNVLEPAMLGKAMIFGPYMHNFADETEGLLAQQAALQLQDIKQLPDVLSRLLKDKVKCQAQGERAQLFMRQQGDVLERYLSEIDSLCPKEPTTTRHIT